MTPSRFISPVSRLQRPQRVRPEDLRVELERAREPVEGVRVRRVRDLDLRRRALKHRAVVAKDLERQPVARGQAEVRGADTEGLQDHLCELGGAATGTERTEA